ncbi:putative short-chain dehydrogenase [Trichophyton interdigitale]|uniref:Peroxisomal short-chain alcohol dehydrogenase n=1 Tax=Trichophyton interdigitale TaxID=101480 RepID=A0A9P5CWG5_9EURO|nr:Peroxisomal short-chain alcohol dehydrogenase [Trichophyton interdigitale]KAF3894294.1 Peroxisomal short-chain alcohol dehydrogenase [Trichophyton interdigitale]KAG8207913.1 putative short-chain dehydrogenase [Trichophyton interdigitale]
MAAFTFTQHSSVYPAIDASQPELSQAGRTILITGASYGIGFAALQGFAKASAARIILLGRQRDSLASACERLRAQNPSFQGELITYACDIGDAIRVAQVWEDLNRKSIAVDVMIVNAGDPGTEATLDTVPLQLAWRAFEINVRGNLDMVQRFVQQGKTADFSGRKRVLINISSRLTHDHDASVGFGSYASTKIAFTSMVQHLATEVPVEQLQILNVHPGDVYTEGVQKLCEKDSWPSWDDPSLPENYIVWAASPAASFLHGRFVWANWDVTELKSCEALTDGKPENKNLLKIGVNGLVFALPSMTVLLP